jgi:galactose mutarotase-like enzyme
MDTIELWHGSTKALVSIDGGWLTNVSDDYGDILFPKRNLLAAAGSKKQRGGSHVCLPNFGPGGLSDQPQHGYGRTVVWAVARQTQHSITLELPHGDDEYQDLSAQLTYELQDSGLSMTVKLVNNSSQAYRIAPGFHPYFVLADGENTVLIGGDEVNLNDLAGTEFYSGTTMILSNQKRRFELHSEDLTTWAAWSDRLGNYVCVEPTFAGNTFEENDDVPKEEMLGAGESRSFSFALSWQLN